MKEMKKILMFFVVLLIAVVSHAQNQQIKDGSMKTAKALQKALKLNDAQTARVAAIYEQKYEAKLKDKQTQAKVKNWADTHNMKAIYDYMLKEIDANEAMINPVLTVEQKKTYMTMQDKARQAIQQKRASLK